MAAKTTRADVVRFREGLRKILRVEESILSHRVRERVCALACGEPAYPEATEKRLARRYPAPQAIQTNLDSFVRGLVSASASRAIERLTKSFRGVWPDDPNDRNTLEETRRRLVEDSRFRADDVVERLVPARVEEDPFFLEKFAVDYLFDDCEAEAVAQERQAAAILAAVVATATVVPGCAEAVAQGLAEAFPPTIEELRAAIIDEARQALEEVKGGIALRAERDQAAMLAAEARTRLQKRWVGS